jgi:hypothetical protein
MPVILATLEAGSGGSQFEASPGQNESLSQNTQQETKMG